MMIESASGDEREDRSARPTQSSHDFSVVQGFQVVGADHHATGQNADCREDWGDALKLELETRAARFHHAVDSAIVLSNDGVIRWLGDPVARLSPGPDALTPGAVILTDEALPEAAREIVKARIELWLVAATRRILGPLFAFEALQGGSEPVRELAGRLGTSFGILERGPIRAQLKALAQSERAELRKFGVRFGAFYVFVPALIKPAARALALQLWSLQAPGDAAALVAALAQVASSGRTSLLLDKKISREGYRVAGYRPCGERIVRVDVIERLSGMIRGAIMESQTRAAPGPAGHARANGFVVSGQMTSLTGCAGEQFASILRSIGYRSVEMKRSEFFGPHSADESPQQRQPPSPAENPEIAADSQPFPVGGGAEGPLDIISASPEATPLNIPRGEEANGLCPDAARAAPGAASAVAPVIATNLEAATNAELIVVWRPDRSAFSGRGAGNKTWRNRDQTPSGERSPRGRLDPPAGPGRGAAGAAEEGRNRKGPKEPRLNLPATDGRKAAMRPPGGAAEHETARCDEKHRQTQAGRDMPRSRPASGGQERLKFDPNSPFAKLLELRALLEGQADKHP